MLAYASYQPSAGSYLVMMFATVILSFAQRERLKAILIKSSYHAISFITGTISYLVI